MAGARLLSFSDRPSRPHPPFDRTKREISTWVNAGSASDSGARASGTRARMRRGRRSGSVAHASRRYSSPLVLDVIDRYPHLVALVGVDDLRKVLTEKGPWRHKLQMISTWENDGRDQYLASLERAAEVLQVVLARSPSRVRAQLAGNLRVRATFEAAVAEVIAGTRLELLGFAPVMEGGSGRQPDFECRADGAIFYVEVYTPGAAPADTLFDDIHWQLRTFQADCAVFLTTAGMKRESKTAREIADLIKRGVLDLKESGATEAIFIVPHGRTTKGWETRIGVMDYADPSGQEPALLARVTIDGVSGFRLIGGSNLEVVNDLAQARGDISGLSQLRRDGTNVLVVDLSARRPNEFSIRAYEQASREACARRPELAGVLLTYRDFGLQPSPSTQHEVRSGYRFIESSRSDAAKLPPGVAKALERLKLIHPGRPE